MSSAQGQATGAAEESYRLVPPVGGSLRPNSMGPAPCGRAAPVAVRRLGRGTLYTLQSEHQSERASENSDLQTSDLDFVQNEHQVIVR